ncbi:MAG TPA: M1 family metallopeptidase [Puia sp.]
MNKKRFRALSVSALLAFVAFMPCTPARAQVYNPDIDVQHYAFSLWVNDGNNNIKGVAKITVLFRKDAEEWALDLAKKNSTGKGMTVTAVKEGSGSVRFTQDSDRMILHAAGRQGEQHTYRIAYEGIPADGLIISNNKYGHRGFFGDNWPNRAHNWLPCVDHPSDKATVDFHITAPDHYQVVANGAKQEEKMLPDHQKLTTWKESVPLSPKVMVVGIADFAIDHPGDTLGVPVYNYVFPENKEIGFRNYAFALQILPFYINHIGPYPFEKCGNVQSKTRFGGLENASAIFYFENSVTSPGVESLMAHEIAHQWFGDAATETEWRYLWLSEGFATYMTHCYLESKYGPDTLKKGLEKDRAKVFAFEKKRKTAVVDSTVKGDYMQLLNPNSYEKGGWVLHMLRRKLGDEIFWKGISTYYASYRNKNASSDDFEKVMAGVSGQDLQGFFHQWLNQPGHPHVKIDWKYDTDKKELVIDFRQTGAGAAGAGGTGFAFTLEYAVDGVPHRVEIQGDAIQVRLPFPEKPATLIPDPNVNLLASFEVNAL